MTDLNGQQIRAAKPQTASRPRWAYLCLVVATILLGLASRRFAAALPVVLRKSSGDALWAMMVFFLVGLLFRLRPTRWIAAAAMAFSVLIEFSQLYHAPWIDAVRSHTLGHLVLGSGFAWGDMLAYAVGVTVGTAFELLMIKLLKPIFMPETPLS